MGGSFVKLFNKTKIIAVVIASILFGNLSVFGASYSDVPATHWAYRSITSLAEKGIIVGDSSGKYYPDKAIDKFYTAKILAKLAGFKYVGLSTEEGLYISRAYTANKGVLDNFASTFKKWDSTGSKEIAFLLEKGILAVTDLNKFVIKLDTGEEKLRALTKEEYCVFLVRLMGKGNEALSSTYTGAFLDDGNISAECKPYVYYLKSLDCISGDAQGKFNPRTAVTKATMAAMTDNVYAMMLKQQNVPSVNQTNTNTTVFPQVPNNTQNTQTTTITNISGTLYKVYPSLNAVQIQSPSGTISTYKFDITASIYVDGSLRTINDLAEEMTITGVLSNQQLVELRAQSVSVGTVTHTETSRELAKIEGTVSEISSTDAAKAITIKIRSISPTGIISTTDKTYSIDNTCVIKRDGESTDFSEIQLGEVIYAGVFGSSIYTIDLERKEYVMSNAVLKAKRYDASVSKPILTVEDEDGKTHDFIVTKDSYLRRVGNGRCKWNELKIGDSIELKATYSNIDEIYAQGTSSRLTGWVDEINISSVGSTITIREDEDENSIKTIYTIGNANIDLYDITLDSKVKLKLDSLEVDDIIILKRGSSKSDAVTGYLYAVKNSYIAIVDSLDSDAYEKIYIDDDTNVIDAVRGKILDIDDLEDDMELYIVIRIENGDKIAKTITIVEY